MCVKSKPMSNGPSTPLYATHHWYYDYTILKEKNEKSFKRIIYTFLGSQLLALKSNTCQHKLFIMIIKVHDNGKQALKDSYI